MFQVTMSMSMGESLMKIRNMLVRAGMLIGVLLLPVLMSGNIGAVEEVPNLDELSGDTVFMQIQKGGGFLFEDGGLLKLGRYSAVANKDLYKWKVMEYPADSGKHILQNIATGKVLAEDLSMKLFNNGSGQFWNLSESPTGDINSTYIIGNVLLNQNITGILETGIALPTLESPNTETSQKVNFIDISDSYSYEIMGTSTISKEAVKDFLISKVGSAHFNSTAPIYSGSAITINQYYNRVLDAYYSIAPVYGVRPEVALAQAFHETGYMKFGGLVTVDDFNFAGIYATGSAITEAEAANLRGADPNKVELLVGEMAARFKTIEYGVEAHIQHLMGYTTNVALTDLNSDGVKEIMGVTLASPRFELLNMLNKRNTGPILPALNGQWAVPGVVYGQMIMNIVKGIPAPIITKTEISDGIYAIDSSYSSLRLDANNTQISQNSLNNLNSQYWNVEQVSDKEYRIISIKSGKALSFRNNMVVHDTWAGDDLQLWTFSPNTNGSYKILSVGNNKSLSLATQSNTNGVAITLNSDYRLATTDFKLVSSSYNKADTVAETKAIKGVMDGIYNIKNFLSNQFINVPTEGSFSYVSPNPRNYIQMTQWSANNSIAQKFKIVRMSTGDFKIIGVNSGKLLTVSDANENAPVFQLYDKYNDNKQFWSIVNSANGYILRNTNTGKNIIVANSLSQGSGLVQSSISQDWILTKLSDIPNFGEKTKGLTGKVIWIDPGHGSAYTGYFDPGAVRTGIREVDSNTWYSIELAERLRAGGATVLLTRTTADPGMTIDNRQRAYLANEANADIYISVHSNASANTSIYGAETYYYLPLSVDDSNYAGTKDYDQRIVKSIVLANLVNPKMAAGGGFTNRGVKGNDFAVIRETAMPAILLEIGFISHSGDLARIKDPTSRTNTVAGIYQGIVEYFDLYGTSELTSDVDETYSSIGLKINNSYISGIKLNTNTDSLTASIKNISPEAQVVIRDSNNNVKSNKILATNDTISITSNSETKTYKVIIYGDTNGDGLTDIIDLLRVQKLILKTMSAIDPFLKASDTNKDGNVDIIDLLRVQKHILGSITIQQ